MSGSRSRARFAADAGGKAAAALAERVRARDPDAERELIARYRPGVTMLLRKLVKDPALVDDLAQEVFRIAFESLQHNRVNETEKLAAYLWGITRNMGKTESRRQRHQQTAPRVQLVDSAMRPDQELLREERARLVLRALDTLSPRDRAVLDAFYLNDTPKESICRQLNLSPAQFDVIKWRALKRLRSLVEREDRDD